MRFQIAFWLAVFISRDSFPQQQGIAVIRFLVSPKNAVVKIDSLRILKTDTTLILPLGSHNIKIWAPKKELFETTLKIEKDTTMVFSKILGPDPEYVDYKNKLSEYKRKKFKGLALAPVSSIGFLLFGAFAKNKSDDYLSASETDKLNYEIAWKQSEIDLYKEQYEADRKNYKIWLGARSVCLVTSVGFMAIFIKNAVKYGMKRVAKPQYESKILLSRVDLGIMPWVDNSFKGYIAIKF